MFKKYIVLLFSPLLLTTCGKDVPTPAYITINKFVVQPNPDATSIEGELNNNFTDTWLYLDGNLLGVFQLPITLPIGQAGSKKLTLIPGVRNNGIESSKMRYPFVENFEQTITLTPLDTVKINPTTEYYSNVTFWIEDFEDASINLTSTPYSKTTIQASNDPAYLKYGTYFGKVNLTTQDSIWDVLTSDQLNLPVGQDVYLEIDYLNTNDVLTGLTAYNVPAQSVKNNPYIQLNAQDAAKAYWKKIYIDLHEIVDNEISSTYFKVALTAVLPNFLTSSFVCIDNIKVVHN